MEIKYVSTTSTPPGSLDVWTLKWTYPLLVLVYLWHLHFRPLEHRFSQKYHQKSFTNLKLPLQLRLSSEILEREIVREGEKSQNSSKPQTNWEFEIENCRRMGAVRQRKRRKEGVAVRKEKNNYPSRHTCTLRVDPDHRNSIDLQLVYIYIYISLKLCIYLQQRCIHFYFYICYEMFVYKLLALSSKLYLLQQKPALQFDHSSNYKENPFIFFRQP